MTTQWPRTIYGAGSGTSLPRYSYPRLCRILLWFYGISGMMFVSQVAAICRWEHCRELQETPFSESDLLREDAAIVYELCHALDGHSKCLKASAKPCRGNLRYYSYLKGLAKVMEKKNCSTILANAELHASERNSAEPSKDQRTTITSTEPPIEIPAFHGCSTMKLQDRVAYCSVFGDPHLITADARFQTCRLQGAYPLIENRHLAIQVSDKIVGQYSSLSAVTSISRVTVIIKSSECSEERRTYEASVGQLFPYFRDSSTDSDSVKLIERIPDRLIEVRILHLKTIVFIRQVGSYLSVSVRLPFSLLTNESALPYQLCSAGCPDEELVSRSAALSDQPLRSIQQAEELCQKQNVTGPFYDACLFDTAVSGNLDSVLSAAEAQQDWERLAPGDVRTAAWAARGEGSNLPHRAWTLGLTNSALWPNVRWASVAISWTLYLVLSRLYLASLSVG